MTSFTEKLRKVTDSIWEANFNHPFVRGIGDGTLPLENFRYYVMQDAYYLSHFAKVQALAGGKADDLHVTARMAFHAQGTYEAELSLHEKFSTLLGITEEEKRAFEPSPTAYAYTSHMYRSAINGSLGEIIACILPCYWIYYEIGERLKECKPEEPIYQEWIAAYGGEWFKELVFEQLERLDQLAMEASEKERQKMIRHFTISCKYELAFWEMAYTMEQWPDTEAVEVQ
ncbi:thiaminase II [Bacillus sp. SJS]|uniref:thiaminase II n=1 Tax=Bacillus sp. SJS TaxID=1423321 RepID=UPI0004DCB6B8|nr:thiaminase II [Bacillus sp. SJS]KZZ84765.1 thiaminase II [Bacillus sp. SJS]